MGHRAKLKGGDEWDAFSRRARRILCYLQRPRVTALLKRKFSKRMRQLTRQKIRRASVDN